MSTGVDKIFSVIVSWQAVLLSFAIFVILGLIRGFGTKKVDGVVVGGWAQSKWFKMFLPLYPYVLSSGLVLIPGIPLPTGMTATVGAKILYAIWCGWFSDKVYQIVKSVLEKGLNVQFGGLPVAPTPTTAAPSSLPSVLAPTPSTPPPTGETKPGN